MRMFAIAACLSIIVVIAIAGTASAAHVTSDPNMGIVRSPATSYLLPTNTSAPVHKGLTFDDRVHVRCVAEGQVIDGSNQWYRIGKDGHLGFVPSSKVFTPTKPPYC